MNKTLSTMAAAILLASTAIAPAYAQTTPAPAPAAPAGPAAPADPAAKPMDPAAKPMDDSAAKPADTGSDTAAMSGGYLTEQGEDQISANEYIGQSIYNAEDKSIGEINDLILKEDGGIVAAVVGVGGFLGIGEKDVGVPIEKITVTRQENEVRLTTTETAEALQAAPEFKTLADKQAETDAATTSSTGAATGMPPAGGAPAAPNN